MHHCAHPAWYQRRLAASRSNVTKSGGQDAGDQRIRHLAALARVIAPVIDPGLEPIDVARALNWALVRLGAER